MDMTDQATVLLKKKKKWPTSSQVQCLPFITSEQRVGWDGSGLM